MKRLIATACLTLAAALAAPAVLAQPNPPHHVIHHPVHHVPPHRVVHHRVVHHPVVHHRVVHHPVHRAVVVHH